MIINVDVRAEVADSSFFEAAHQIEKIIETINSQNPKVKLEVTSISSETGYMTLGKLPNTE